MNIAEIKVRRNTHEFTICVTDKGALTYQMDGENEKHAKGLKDGKLLFIDTQEVIVKGEMQEWKEMELEKEDFALLSDTQERIKYAINEEQTLARLRKEDKGDILKRVDGWKKKIRHYRKEKEGKRLSYAIHDFTIGAQSYRFYERHMDSPFSWDGILINPAYKVVQGIDGAGAVPVQKGALTFWYYHDDIQGQGWHNIRELTINEMICVEIIFSCGMVREGKI